MERLEALLRAQMHATTAPTTGSSSARSAREEAPVCPICEGARFVRVTADPGDPSFGKPVPCECVRAEDDRTRTERLLRFSRLGSMQRFTFDTLLPRGSSAKRRAASTTCA